MIDESGNKYLLIKLSYETSSEVNYSQIDDSQWSLVPNDDFYYTYWLSKEDYEIYRIRQYKISYVLKSEYKDCVKPM